MANKRMKFNAGEALLSANFNDMQSMQEKRYFDNTLRDRAMDILRVYRFDSATSLATLVGKSFFRMGTSAIPVKSLVGNDIDYGSGAGFILTSDSSPTVLGDTVAACKPVFLDGATVTPADGGYTLYYLDSLSDVSGGAESNDFKDAVTGALTSTSLDKRTTVTPVVASSFNAGSMPDPAGEYKLFGAYRSGALSHTELRDFTFPCEKGIIVATTEKSDILNGETGGEVVVTGSTIYERDITTSTRTCFLRPPTFSGFERARLLRVDMRVAIPSGITTIACDLVRRNTSTNTDTTVLQSLFTDATVTNNGTWRLLPRPAVNFDEPIWGNGRYSPQSNDITFSGSGDYALSAGDSSELAIRLSCSAASGTHLLQVGQTTWYFAV